MRHRVDGRQFGRNTSHRLAMFRNMANSVILQEQVVTTVAKAKEIRRVVDRLVTLGKTQDEGKAKKGQSAMDAARRTAFDRTRDNAVVSKLFTTLRDRYAKRDGGYTRVLKLADRRWGDAAEMAMVELVDHPAIDRGRQNTKAKPDGSAAGAGADKAVASTGATPANPFKKIGKLFQPKKAGKATAASKGAGKASTAGGGGSKKGGSS